MTQTQFSPFNWRPLTLADAYKPRPPTRWAVDGVFRLPSLNIVFGAPGCLKSLLMADCCACVASGQPWLEPLPGVKAQSFKTEQLPVAYLDFDNGPDTEIERIEAVGRARQLPESAPFYHVSMPQPWLTLDKLGHSQALADWLKALGIRFAVLDCLGTISGDADENSGDMVQVMAALRYVSEYARCALVVIHHQRKASGVKVRAGDSLRGHSSIEASLDLALQVDRDDDLVTVEPTKTRRVDVDTFAARFTYSHKPATLDLAEARFFGDLPAKLSANQSIRHAILALLDKARMNRSALVSAVQNNVAKVSEYKIRSVLGSLVRRGEVLESPGHRPNEKLYSTPMTP